MTNVKRYLVTGLDGQVVQSLFQQAANDASVEIVAVGRPKLDLARPETITAAVIELKPDLIISAAAYTAVDQAESESALAHAVNSDGPSALAAAAAELDIPIVHISTDYVFDGAQTTPYCESDAVAPLGIYGASKLAGEKAVAAATDNYAILRTAWVYSPFGKNFLKTMLRVAEGRDVVNVVDDQFGNPTSALDIADAVLAVSRGLLASSDPGLRGIFHMTATGQASWADFAEEIFRACSEIGGPSAQVNRIPSSDYPTPAKRPTNSRLNCGKLLDIYGVSLPQWQSSTRKTVAQIIQTARANEISGDHK
ncbi:dTDP-4-dehydrorhamnose reductase [Agrobacterium rubi]|uniref:dTDP-4-dehydrorhamnose reductase n=1 Tax=Agrobacterium rubi TaxID=28099 RepID=A0AAE7RD47_9HYPH|nr:dTDP-4-dehydrorhamnose reductase [Agrobacterium rubi]NTE87886.1 dTDP-4-dehydrorhamnose reductase [Agrobacterium rubi]NTF05116.1 dTDP-4-dehydrorhamnose reductase [Agrobacterium rubi]NTF37979.1 dTDP-4-dehydrorhamnose reductase [Agrobacterium rubi]OCJ54228.1 dTDP-4-dehydrorhamnose reductase [Agrobacterium rubi]QTG01834.1 dTDP-4-dehydrorhamnose reductase [Agrobacterium rubi]